MGTTLKNTSEWATYLSTISWISTKQIYAYTRIHLQLMLTVQHSIKILSVSLDKLCFPQAAMCLIKMDKIAEEIIKDQVDTFQMPP
jgi:hypothetical protein